jgi:hypothetical protein
MIKRRRISAKSLAAPLTSVREFLPARYDWREAGINCIIGLEIRNWKSIGALSANYHV